MIIIGADGGGTKTAVQAFEVTPQGEWTALAQAAAGPMNYNFISVEEAAGNLLEAISRLQLDENGIMAVGIADPSLDDCVPAAEQSLTAQFAGIAQEQLGVPVFIRSDAYITLFGLTGGKESAVLQLAGTGAMAIAQNCSGEVKVAGGWGRLTGDEGSGYFIASEAIKAALHAADGIGEKTALLNAAMTYFGVQTPRELIGVFYGDPEPDIAGFAHTAAACAGQGDAAAQKILCEAAKYLAAYTSRLIEWSGSTKVGVYGSVICQNQTIRQKYEELLKNRFENVTIMEPPVSAAEAAAQYAFLKYREAE